jgi:hypothetical protein
MRGKKVEDPLLGVPRELERIDRGVLRIGIIAPEQRQAEVLRSDGDEPLLDALRGPSDVLAVAFVPSGAMEGRRAELTEERLGREPRVLGVRQLGGVAV